MAALTDHRPTVPAISPTVPAIRLEPVRFHHIQLDGAWSPHCTDPIAALPGLVRALDAARGPVVRLLLSAVGWSPRPSRILLGGRVVSVGYFSDQPPALLTAICADGTTVTLLIDAATPGTLPATL
ncbi:DUF5994 family protein [Micromonosporaceae bacterium Da 78-11]